MEIQLKEAAIEKMTFADLKAMRDHCLAMSEVSGDQYSVLGKLLKEEMEKRIQELI